MARRKKVIKFVIGVLIGIFFSHLFITSKLTTVFQDMCFKSARRHKTKQSNYMNKRTGSGSANGGVGSGGGDGGSDNIDNLLFVGVMTAEKYLDTRAKAVYNTWGLDVPGDIKFYSSEFSYSDDVPLIPLPGVDDSYPPQKKSFMMLKHMYDNYIDQYEWFLRADDDLYVRTDRLEELLRSVDSKKPWFIGQTGRGNNEEFGLLSLESDENFCMGGPGVILSRETLRRMAPYVEECLGNLYTTHEDVELGRCVRRFAGISCTWSYEASDCTCKMQVILYHNQSGPAAFAGDLKQKEVHRAITLHPVKKPRLMYRLHKYIKGLKVLDYQQENLRLHRDIASSMTQLGYKRKNIVKAHLVKDLPLFQEIRGSDKYLGDTNIFGVSPSITKYRPHNVGDILEWEIISKSLYSHRDLNPRKRIGSSIKEGLGDIIREVMDIVNSYSKERGRVIDFKEILYGYWRLDPVHGADVVLDLLLVYRKYRGHKMTVQVRRHAYIQQAFTGIHIREISEQSVVAHQTKSNTEVLPMHKKIVNGLFNTIQENIQPILNLYNIPKKETINFILPLSGRYKTFTRFLKMYEDVCIRNQEESRLFIILYNNVNQPGDYNKTKEAVENLQNKYTPDSIKLIEIDESFTRAKALQYGVNSLEENSLMLFIDVDIIFSSQSLMRIRMNSVKNNYIYFPIVYSLYNPKLLNKSYKNANYSIFTSDFINADNGFWRQFGFGIVSLYKSDYEYLGGFNLSISGWGAEDVSFFDNVVKSDIKIIRSVDPNLIHVYHMVNCDENLDVAQKSMCLGTKANTLGSLNQLQILYKKYKYLFR